MAARWTQYESVKLIELLSDGFPIYLMKHHIKSRTEGAIIRKALRLNYSVKTFQDDGIKRFYYSVNRKSSVRQHNGFIANQLAVKILRDNRIEVNPEMIHYLSTRILRGTL